MEYCFIIEPVHTQGNTLPKQPRIVKFDPVELKGFSYNPSFDSLEELLSNDVEFINFKKKFPSAATAIALEKNIKQLAGGIITINDGDIDSRNWYMLEHTISGTIRRKHFTGCHYLAEIHPHVIKNFQILQPEDSKGVYEAKFNILSPNGRLLTKKDDGTSTMFPKRWTHQQLYHEIDFAWRIKFGVEGNATLFKSVTLSNILVDIITNEGGKFVTIYPIRMP